MGRNCKIKQNKTELNKEFIITNSDGVDRFIVVEIECDMYGTTKWPIKLSSP